MTDLGKKSVADSSKFGEFGYGYPRLIILKNQSRITKIKAGPIPTNWCELSAIDNAKKSFVVVGGNFFWH